MVQKRHRQRKPDKNLELPTPYQATILQALGSAPRTLFAWEIADAVQATVQRRRDMHFYLKKLGIKGFLVIEKSCIGFRGPPRPLWQLTDKAREWLKLQE